MKKLFVVIAVFAMALIQVGCASYGEGVKANNVNYENYIALQLAQHKTIQKCYDTSTNKSGCSILSASTNALQAVASKAEQIRVPKSPSEVAESIIKDGLQGAVLIYGFKQVSQVIQAGYNAAGKVEVVRPEVVNPTVIQPEPIFAFPLSQVQ